MLCARVCKEMLYLTTIGRISRELKIGDDVEGSSRGVFRYIPDNNLNRVSCLRAEI